MYMYVFAGAVRAENFFFYSNFTLDYVILSYFYFAPLLVNLFTLYHIFLSCVALCIRVSI